MIKKTFSREQALKKAESYCVYQERSQQEVRDKIYSWGLHRKDVEEIISFLITNGYIKEERFASAYAGGKFRIKKWGRNKIRIALQSKSVSEPLIRQALATIDEREYRKILAEVIHAREKITTEKNVLKKNYKVAAYAISRGFEAELVWETIKQFDDESI